jgi:phage recombination protein Bet
MAADVKRLNHDKECGKCGGRILAGTPLDDIVWNAPSKVWEHRVGRCTQAPPGQSTLAPAPSAPAAARLPAAPVSELWGFSQQQIDLIKDITAPKADLTNKELAVFLYTARRLGLDPVARQIYAVKYRDRKTGDQNMSILTSIDGYRSVAARSGQLDGIDEPVFGPEVEADGGKYPEWARVTVYRRGAAHGFTATVRWKEYRGVRENQLTRFWAQMPYTMLGKVAESHALRKAFAADLSGVYTEDEMAQAENRLPGPSGPDAPPSFTEDQKRAAVDAEPIPPPPVPPVPPAPTTPPAPTPATPSPPADEVDPAVAELVREIEANLTAGRPGVIKGKRELLNAWLSVHALSKLEQVLAPDSTVTVADLETLRATIGEVGVTP